MPLRAPSTRFSLKKPGHRTICRHMMRALSHTRQPSPPVWNPGWRTRTVSAPNRYSLVISPAAVCIGPGASHSLEKNKALGILVSVIVHAKAADCEFETWHERTHRAAAESNGSGRSVNELVIPCFHPSLHLWAVQAVSHAAI